MIKNALKMRKGPGSGPFLFIFVWIRFPEDAGSFPV